VTLKLCLETGQAEHTLVCDLYTTLLEGLEEVRRHHAPTLLYRHSCHHGSCGTCGVSANGRATLACLARLQDLGDVVVVEPLRGFPVVRDLVSDTRVTTRAFPDGYTPLLPSEVAARTGALPPREVPGFMRLESCIECGLCVSACPVTDGFAGPAALAAHNRVAESAPHRVVSVLERVARGDGVAACEQAFECSRVCPMGVSPGRHIANLRRRLAGRSTA
jgi:succinate dehydrogenase / fumarate reductase iron-sulfur subunit